MKLGKAGWFSALLREEAARSRALAPGRAPEEVGRASARRCLRETLRQSGLLHGLPASEIANAADAGSAKASGSGAALGVAADALVPELRSAPSVAADALASGRRAAPGVAADALAPARRSVPDVAPEAVAAERRSFFAVVRTFSRLGLEVAARAGLVEGDLAEWLLIPFAALVGELELAEGLARQRLEKKPATARQWSKVESALSARAEALSGDPAYGLVLHTGVVFVDGQLFGRLALSASSEGAPRSALWRRLGEVAARQKAVLVELLTALACAEHPLGEAARRVVLGQIEQLQLEGEQEAALKARVRQAVAAPPRLAEVVRGVKSASFKRFLLEQALLAALVDGRRSSAELAFLAQLTDALGLSPAERSRYEVEMSELYAQHRDVVDVLTRGARSGRGEALVGSARASLERNYRRLLQEAKETGELSVLLAKAARGGTLTADERRRMREQLLDVAKAIPALAIFAAPGGMFLLLALAKVLPFSLLPSSFRDDA